MGNGLSSPNNSQSARVTPDYDDLTIDYKDISPKTATTAASSDSDSFDSVQPRHTNDGSTR